MANTTEFLIDEYGPVLGNSKDISADDGAGIEAVGLPVLLCRGHRELAGANRELLVDEALVRDAYGAARDAELSGHVTPGRQLCSWV